MQESSKILNFALVFVGGGIGSALRYFIAQSMNSLTSEVMSRFWYPYGTALVNILGAVILGAYLGLTTNAQQSLTNPTRDLLVVTGILGGFTTYSAFCLDSMATLESGKIWTWTMFQGIHFILGPAFFFISRALFSRL